jgi:hypothetical protein
MRQRFLSCLVRAPILLIVFTIASTAAAEDLPALMARPMTPGSVALLAEHVHRPATQKRLVEAVRHEDAAVRAVAARVAFITMSKGLAPSRPIA